MKVNYARRKDGYYGFYFIGQFPGMKHEQKEYRIQTLEKPLMFVKGERDRCDLNYYHTECACGEFEMFNPDEIRKPCQRCGAYLKLVNRGKKADETDNLISQAIYFG